MPQSGPQAARQRARASSRRRFRRFACGFAKARSSSRNVAPPPIAASSAARIVARRVGLPSVRIRAIRSRISATPRISNRDTPGADPSAHRPSSSGSATSSCISSARTIPQDTADYSSRARFGMARRPACNRRWRLAEVHRRSDRYSTVFPRRRRCGRWRCSAVCAPCAFSAVSACAFLRICSSPTARPEPPGSRRGIAVPSCGQWSRVHGPTHRDRAGS